MNYDELYQLVDREFGESTDTGDLMAFANSMTKIDDLLYLRDFLIHCGQSSKHMLFTFLVMKQIVERKGCLMNVDQLMKVLGLFLEVAIVVDPEMSDNGKILSILAESIAITARFVFEQNKSTFETIMQRIRELLNSDNDRDVEIGLKIVGELCDRFQKELYHLPVTENSSVKIGFRQRVCELAKILKAILNREKDPVLLDETLKAMCAVIEFAEGTAASEMSLLTFTNIPRDFPDSTLLDHLFHALTIPMLREKALKLLYLTVSGNKSLWSSPNSRLKYIYDFTSRFTDIPPIDNAWETARLLQRLGCQLDLSFLSEEIAEKFFSNAIAFSVSVFAELNEDCRVVVYVLDFWSKVRCWATRASSAEREQLDATVVQAFHSFVDSILQEIQKSPNSWASKICEMPFDVLQEAWSMIDYEQALQAGNEFADTIDKRDDNVSSVLQCSFLIRMATAKLQSSKGSIFVGDHLEKIYDSVVKATECTNSIIPALIELMGTFESVFEYVLVEFIAELQTHMGRRLGKPIKAEKVQSQEEIRIISIFLNRMAMILSSPVSTPEILRTVLVTIETIINKKEIWKSLKDTALVGELLSFSLTINFEHLPFEDTKASRKLLGKVYTSLVSNDNDLRNLMSVYDLRWENCTSEQVLLCFYVELKGMFKGVASNKGQYAQLLLWFSERYFQRTVEAIRQFSGNFEVVKAICDLWISMFPDGLQDKRFSHNSGFGIHLFRQSVEIVDSLVSRINEADGLQVALKVIRHCLTTECANFGVMAYYRDKSYPHMVNVFISLLSREDILSPGLIQVHKNVFNILRSLSAILRVDGTAVIKTRDNLEVFSRVTQYFLTHYDMGAEPGLMWQETCNTLVQLFSVIASDPQLFEMFSVFRHDVLVVIEALFSRYEDYLVDSALVVLYSALYDSEFVNKTVEDLCGMFEEQHRGVVGECFASMISGFHPPITAEDHIPFKVRATTFMSSMRKYRLGSNSFLSLKSS